MRSVGPRKDDSPGPAWARGVAALALALVAVAGGCATVTPSFDSVEPAARNAAIVQAAQRHDRSSVPQLVRMLRSDDPTTRVLAIRTLEQLTGQTHGYDALDTPDRRASAIERWQASLGQSSAPEASLP